ncbi:MAG TPA: GlsB/YeaQ/YmgE family stress response membrane protein [Burkholderiaceae bacterium]|jgi:uncharacterized membrane protein YeaQ/YmgE (transglycosylase-associated protein family)
MIGNLMAWLLVGGLIGWMVSMLLRTGRRELVLVHIALGGLGALLAGWLLSPLVAGPSSLAAFAVASLGAAALLSVVAAIASLIRRARLHGPPPHSAHRP